VKEDWWRRRTSISERDDANQQRRNVETEDGVQIWVDSDGASEGLLDGVSCGLDAVGDDHDEERREDHNGDVDPERESPMLRRDGSAFDGGDDGETTIDAKRCRGDADLESSSNLSV
jgi:hypothetical protein